MAGRKVLGSLIVVLIGLPILFGIIWAVGLVRATMSSEFLTDLPQEIISEIPSSLDGLYTAAKDPSVYMDQEARAWFLAAEKTGIAPRELLEKTGMMGWMKGELSGSLRRIGEVLRGEADMRAVTIDMRPLKTALLHPEMERFLGAMIESLPACDDQGLKDWEDIFGEERSWGRDLPACRPIDAEAAKTLVLSRLNRDVERIDDTVDVFEGSEPFPFRRFGVARTVTAMTYSLFFLPAIFILLGVWIANRNAAGRLRWAGISVLAGSGPVFLMALFLKKLGSWAMDGRWMSWRWDWNSGFESTLMDKFGWIPGRIFESFFTPVFNTAAVVAVIGVVLIALSYTTRSAAQPARVK
ncbi:MAG: hypothetical protein JW843_01620 [Candidatus Aminicenantes bacterium]|nr:hypothetical protein [Candidatus Aminicenantes bacterium]